MKAISFLSASIPWNFHKAGRLVSLRVLGTRRKLRSFRIRATERSEISTPKRLAICATSAYLLYSSLVYTGGDSKSYVNDIIKYWFPRLFIRN